MGSKGELSHFTCCGIARLGSRRICPLKSFTPPSRFSLPLASRLSVRGSAMAGAVDDGEEGWTRLSRLDDLPPLRVVWQFEERTVLGHTGWVDMDPRVIEVIESGRRRGFDMIPFTLRGRTYEADLRDMVQRVVSPVRPWERAIRRAFLPVTPEVGAGGGRLKDAGGAPALQEGS